MYNTRPSNISLCVNLVQHSIFTGFKNQQDILFLIRSKKIPEKLNYQLKGTLKASRLSPLTGKVSDTLIYAKYDTNDLPNLTVEWNKHE